MTRFIIALAAAAIFVPGLVAHDAHAQRGKDHIVRDYKFDKPMNGYSGHAGAYYCDFIKIPNRTCTASGCKITSWTLRQTCY